MKAFLIRSSIIAAVSLLLIAVATSFSREEYIIYITAVMGAILGLLAFEPLEGSDRPVPLRISYVAVFAFFGLFAGRSLEAVMRQQFVFAMIYAGFTACGVVGFAIGKHYRSKIRKLFGLRGF